MIDRIRQLINKFNKKFTMREVEEFLLEYEFLTRRGALLFILNISLWLVAIGSFILMVLTLNIWLLPLFLRTTIVYFIFFFFLVFKKNDKDNWTRD